MVIASPLRYLSTLTASDIYKTVTFNTDSLYNEPAPEPWISFLIGGVFSLIGIVYCVRRWYKIHTTIISKHQQHEHHRDHYWSLQLRAIISAALDCDDAAYTICKMAAQSFLFLGGIQLDYTLAFTIMLVFFGVESCGDSVRVLLAVHEAHSLREVIVTSSIVKATLAKANTSQLKPTNVYEDLSRDKLIVLLVFITQAVLISFVVADIYDSQTHTCYDGTKDCPIVGTFGSWSFYVLGVFMATVFLLGPKTSFGQSEQNPAYWLQLLLHAKQQGVKYSWYDPNLDKTITRDLKPNDWHIWTRFFMSFLINGVGFHILVHALPIQIASQSGLLGVVIRAVGMMYLVDLDDTPGYVLTIVENMKIEEDDDDKDDKGKKDQGNKQNGITPVQDNLQAPTNTAAVATSSSGNVPLLSGLPTGGQQQQQALLQSQVQQILDNARAQLDALAQGHGVDLTRTSDNKNFTKALVAAGGIGIIAAPVVLETIHKSEQQKQESTVPQAKDAEQGVVNSNTGEDVTTTGGAANANAVGGVENETTAGGLDAAAGDS